VKIDEREHSDGVWTGGHKHQDGNRNLSHTTSRLPAAPSPSARATRRSCTDAGEVPPTFICERRFYTVAD
jgi:hypothetical protein